MQSNVLQKMQNILFKWAIIKLVREELLIETVTSNSVVLVSSKRSVYHILSL